MQKIEEKEKIEVKTRRRRIYKWTILSVFGGLMIVGVIIGLLICITSPFELRGVSFNVESGFYDESIDLEIETDGGFWSQPSIVKYNLNGDDLENTGELFNESIKLEVPEEGYKLYTVTAKACKENGECTDSEVATYVLGKNLVEDITIDIVSINSSQKNLYDYDTGIMVGGRTYDENSANGGMGFIGGNYSNRGKKWMRKAYIVRFNDNGQKIWDQDAYLGISGGTSAAYGVKSLKIVMASKGEDGNNEETFRLRSGSQDQFSANIRSSVVDRLAEQCGFDGRTGTDRIVVFLNGEYYGLFDMQTTFSEHNLLQKFELGDEKKIKKFRGSEKSVFEAFGLDESYWENLDSSENRERLEKEIDIDDYLMYYAIFILTNNTDWPMNNFEAWKYKDVDNAQHNKYEDGRIRFLIRDTDLVYYTEGNIGWFEGAIGDIFVFLMEEKYNGARSSFKKVMESEDYRERFIDLLREYLDGPFATENILRIIDEEAAKIEHQVKLFSSKEEYNEWTKQIELMRKAVSKREGEIKVDVQKYFGVKL